MNWLCWNLTLAAMLGNDLTPPEQFNPVADPAATIAVGNARLTVLTPELIRLEWSPTGRFEDRPTVLVRNRRLPVPDYSAREERGALSIRTESLHLTYSSGGERFSSDNLAIELSLPSRTVRWHPGLPAEGNLGGTARTLDGVDGRCALEPGLTSRDGWALLDDSGTAVLAGDPAWPKAREQKKALDWYFFGHGHDYPRALRAYTKIAGRIPLPPKFVFGSWWSRFWPYSDDELKRLVREFDEHEVPLDVLVIDMDWHLPGWSGYTWDPKHFPDPQGFLAWAHEQGLRVTLNLHPGFEIEEHEARFAEFARAAGHDAKRVESVRFDHADRRFTQAYFEHLIHPLEEQGVDFWWLDFPGQFRETSIEGLDALLWLNAIHWRDMQRSPRRGDLRPILFSRWGGLANHRYQIGFSGDTWSTWDSLAFQPEFTATAGNVCFPYWSHDIGGHVPGYCEPELYARWIQLGALSPVLRTHTTRGEKAERRIWAFSDAIFRAARAAFRLRYSLLPYLYTAARVCYDTALPLCRPLYYEWPELDEAYRHRAEYLLGEQLLIAPVTVPMNPIGRAAVVRVWLPPGRWTHWYSGQTFEGPVEVTLSAPLDEIPIFVREGGVIPAMPEFNRIASSRLDPLIIHVFPGDSGETRLYEDDGVTRGYQRNEFCWTPITFTRVERGWRITVGPTEGSYDGMFSERQLEIRLHDVWPAAGASVNGQPLPRVEQPTDAVGWCYDERALTTVVRTPPRPVRTATQVTVEAIDPGGDESALRGGLRGRLRLLREIADLLGDATPTEVRAALDIPARLRDDPAKAPQIATQPVDDWDSIVAQAIDAAPADPVGDRVIARLAGLTYDFRLGSASVGDRTIEAVTELAVNPPFDAAPQFGAVIRFLPPPGWSVQAEATQETAHLRFDEPFVQTARFRCDGPLSTAIVKAEVVLRRGDRTVRRTLQRVLLPSIDAWWIVGPFDAPFSEGLDRAFPPETKIDLDATYSGKGGRQIRWRSFQRMLEPGSDLTAEFHVDLNEFLGGVYGDAVAYALTYLHAPEAMDASVALGSDDGVVVWLNGREVFRKLVARGYSSRQDRAPVRLRAGVNTLLLKVNQGGGDWGFGAHIETPDGRPLPDVRASLQP